MLLQVINGTTREGRFSERVAAWVMGRLEQHPAFEVELVDLRDHPLPFFDADSPAKTGRDYTDEAVVRFSRVIDRADGYVILTAEYNHGIPGVLKNAIDVGSRPYGKSSFLGKPIGIISRADLLRALEPLLAPDDEISPCTDAALAQSVIDALGAQPWVPPGLTVGAAGGVVTVYGVVSDPREERAVTVLVENVPGVKSVDAQLTYVDVNAGISLTGLG